MESNEFNRNAVFRVLDANINRAAEGLRTLEEYFRFIAEDATVSATLKQLRHDLAGVVSKFDRRELLSNRDVSGDIGCSIQTDSERNRADVQSIIAAAIQRVQQSLRCLEEYGKLIDPAIGEALEQIRYRAYDVFSDVELLAMRDLGWLENARLYVLIDCQLPFTEFLAKVSDLSNAGVDIIQIRDKQRDARTILEYARHLADHLDKDRTRIVMNDRVDLAALVGSGVHLGQEDLPIADVRPLLPSGRVIGISTHGIDQVLQAKLDGADYLGCGPTFASQTKAFERFPGLDFLGQVAHQTTLPAFAIGGISLDRLDEVLSTGIQRVAVSHAIWHAKNPAAVAHEFAQRLAIF